MKRFFNYFFILVAVIGVFALTACGNKNDEKDKYVGTYKAEDSSEITITKENDVYNVEISLFRLTTLRDCSVENIKDDVLSLSCTAGNETTMKLDFDYNKKLLTVVESQWDLLSNEDSFEFE